MTLSWFSRAREGTVGVCIAQGAFPSPPRMECATISPTPGAQRAAADAAAAAQRQRQQQQTVNLVLNCAFEGDKQSVTVPITSRYKDIVAAVQAKFSELSLIHI